MDPDHSMGDWCSGPHFKNRRGGKRFRRTMGLLTPRQEKWVCDYGFESFLAVSDFSVKPGLADWIMQKINPDLFEYRRGNRVIVFDKILTRAILGLWDGDLPVNPSGSSEEAKELRAFYKPYFSNDRLGTDSCETLLRTLNDEEVNEYDWSSHIVRRLMFEIKKYQSFTLEQRQTDFQIGECIPLLLIVYMDHLDLPTTGAEVHIVKYDMPRICHVTNDDFKYVEFADRRKLSTGFLCYGNRPFRPRNEVPYYTVQANVGHAVQRGDGVQGYAAKGGAGGDSSQGGAGVGAQDSASFDVWVRMPASSSQGSQVPASVQAIIVKHSSMWNDKFVSAMEAFQKSMIKMHSKMTADMLSEVTMAMGTRNKAGSTDDVVLNQASTDQTDKTAVPDVPGTSKQQSSGGIDDGAEILADLKHLHIVGEDVEVRGTGYEVRDSSGPSTHELKNRKKRAHKDVDDDDVAEVKKMRINTEVEEVYKRIMKVNITRRRAKKGKSSDE
uniref:Uncharacterized protein n=1 Tax=Leersia perrieri TaxID=77586 RepID=A0A0D9VVJ0_9ORYZ